MAQQVRGVVCDGQGRAGRRSRPITVPDPGPGEALVAVQACGVCHTDLHYREGAINDDFPFLLGHEAAGTVEAVGTGVDGLAPGDYVVIAWRAPCGTCRSCRRGRPWYCFDSRNAGQPMTLADGTAAVARPRHRRLRRQDPGGRRPVRQGRPAGPPGGGRPDRLRDHGRLRGRGQHRRGGAGRHGGRVRLRRGGRRRHRRRRRWPAPARSSPSTSTPASWSWPAASAPPTSSTPPPTTRSRPSGR